MDTDYKYSHSRWFGSLRGELLPKRAHTLPDISEIKAFVGAISNSHGVHELLISD